MTFHLVEVKIAPKYINVCLTDQSYVTLLPQESIFIRILL